MLPITQMIKRPKFPETEFDKVLRVAKMMHRRYEFHAKRVGWKTQDGCSVPFDNLPTANKEVMIGLARDVIEWRNWRGRKRDAKQNGSEDSFGEEPPAYSSGQAKSD